MEKIRSTIGSNSLYSLSVEIKYLNDEECQLLSELIRRRDLALIRLILRQIDEAEMMKLATVICQASNIILDGDAKLMRCLMDMSRAILSIRSLNEHVIRPRTIGYRILNIYSNGNEDDGRKLKPFIEITSAYMMRKSEVYMPIQHDRSPRFVVKDPEGTSTIKSATLLCLSPELSLRFNDMLTLKDNVIQMKKMDFKCFKQKVGLNFEETKFCIELVINDQLCVSDSFKLLSRLIHKPQ